MDDPKVLRARIESLPREQKIFLLNAAIALGLTLPEEEEEEEEFIEDQIVQQKDI